MVPGKSIYDINLFFLDNIIYMFDQFNLKIEGPTSIYPSVTSSIILDRCEPRIKAQVNLCLQKIRLTSWMIDKGGIL